MQSEFIDPCFNDIRQSASWPLGRAPSGMKGDQSEDFRRIARNSLFLTLQPLVMNLVSLLAVAYIARTLGVSDFGIFNLVTTYAVLFNPLAQAGMNRVMVRDMASLDDKAGYAARMFPLRVVITGLAAVGLVVTALVAGYDDRTTLAIVAGSSIFVGQLLAEIFADVFLASERTHFTAIAQLVAGLTLTVLSVAVLYVGLGLFAMIAVYALGQFLGLALSVYFLHTRFFGVRWRPDRRFARQKLVEGLPFFASMMMWTLMSRIDTVVVSKWCSPVDLGLYTAAMLLVTRMSVIPMGISTALLPTISRLWSTRGEKEASDLVRGVSDALLIIALPAVIVVGAFSSTITSVLFGPGYGRSSVVLTIGIWTVLLRCLGSVQFCVLAASNRERNVMKSYVVATVYCIVSNWVLVSSYGIVGAATASLSTQLLVTILFAWYSPVIKMFHTAVVAKATCLGGAMLVAAYATRGWNPFLSVGLVSSLGASLAYAVGLVRPENLTWLAGVFRRA